MMHINKEAIELVRMIHPEKLVEVDRIRYASANVAAVRSIIKKRIQEVCNQRRWLTRMLENTECLEMLICDEEAAELKRVFGNGSGK